MNNKRVPLITEEPKHKKKSTAKGLSRSKHKHIYQTVLLKSYHSFTDYKTGKLKISFTEMPTKICSICGRVDCVDTDPSLYEYEEIRNLPFYAYDKKLSKKALALPRYYKEDFWDKFAKEGDKLNNV